MFVCLLVFSFRRLCCGRWAVQCAVSFAPNAARPATTGRSSAQATNKRTTEHQGFLSTKNQKIEQFKDVFHCYHILLFVFTVKMDESHSGNADIQLDDKMRCAT